MPRFDAFLDTMKGAEGSRTENRESSRRDAELALQRVGIIASVELILDSGDGRLEIDVQSGVTLEQIKKAIGNCACIGSVVPQEDDIIHVQAVIDDDQEQQR